MDITYIGHQSWLISKNNTNIIVDPLITDTFGTSKELQFRIYPPRSISINNMPKLNGILITNEHLDHFHLLSLTLLDKSIPIYIGNMMPECVKQTINRLGFKIVEFYNGQKIDCGDLKVSFYIGHQNVPFWEKRVYQLHITDKNDYGIFIQSDTLISDYFINQVLNGTEKCPEIFITTNNSQILPKNCYNAFDNLLPIHDPYKTGHLGVNIFEEILVQYTSKLPSVKHIILSGNGYIIDKENAKPFLLSEYEIIEQYINELSLSTKVHLPIPGEKLIFSSKISDKNGLTLKENVDWIKLNNDRYDQYIKYSKSEIAQNNSYLLNSIFKRNIDLDTLEEIKIIKSELDNIAKFILLTPFGQTLLSSNEYIEGPLGSQRFIICFKIYEQEFLFFELDLNKAAFNQVDIEYSSLLRKYPYGIELFITDFIALLEGKIQIWELTNSNMRQWYLGDKMNSPVAFLYCYFSEQIRQDLAYKVYNNILANA